MVTLPAESLTTGESSGSRPQEDGGETKKLALNSGEQLYAELRDKNFSAVGSLLSRKAKLISAQFDVSRPIVIKLDRHAFSHSNLFDAFLIVITQVWCIFS